MVYVYASIGNCSCLLTTLCETSWSIYEIGFVLDVGRLMKRSLRMKVMKGWNLKNSNNLSVIDKLWHIRSRSGELGMLTTAKCKACQMFASDYLLHFQRSEKISKKLRDSFLEKLTLTINLQSKLNVLLYITHTTIINDKQQSNIMCVCKSNQWLIF